MLFFYCKYTDEIHINLWIIVFLQCHSDWQGRPQKSHTCAGDASLPILHRC